ncbi:MAG: hypothetical protein OEZ34_15420 [Spirochaetia bacterium]|nr:hypothetical protein [Spirochaetia bacterium]
MHSIFHKKRIFLDLILAGSFFLLISYKILPQKKILSNEQQNEIEELLDRAEEHILESRYRVAEKYLQKVKHIDPENAQAYSLSGDIHLIMNELDKAESDFRLALELSERKDREYFRLGQIYYLREEEKESRKYFMKALNENPKLHICRFYLGMIELNLLRNKEKTIFHWEAYRKLEPEDPQGPEIDRAIALLKDKNFKLPPKEKKQKGIVVIQGNGNGIVIGGSQILQGQSLPESGNIVMPDLKAAPEKEKTSNEGEGIMVPDDL